MAKQLFVTEASVAAGVRIEFQPLPASKNHPAGYAWGNLALWLGDTLVWSEGADADEKPVVWSWVNLLEGLGRVWPWLTLEEGYPIPIHPEHPGKLDAVLSERWDGMVGLQRDDEEDLIFDFNHRHNLALLVRGISLPRVMVMREGNEMVLWSPARSQPVRIPLSEFIRIFEAFGDCLSHLLTDSTRDLAVLARKRWSERAEKTLEYKTQGALESEEPEVKHFFETLNYASDAAANDDLYADDEVRAAARMTAKKFMAVDRVKVLEAIQNIRPRKTPILDQLSQSVPDASEYSPIAFQQGYWLAIWLREELQLGAGNVDPRKIIEGWGIEIFDIQVDPEICAVAVWGRHHGPGVILNKTKNSRASGINGCRATLAHEICHLIYDRERSLPVADVMGGFGPQFAEKRANAFAAEFLLPRASAASEVGNSTDDIVVIAKKLERRFGVSRAIVRHQIQNSSSAEFLDPKKNTALDAWARQQPGFPVVEA
ncbi:ImmA/IrrE family metallo-endopeptidase [Pseudomonas graminis]|uniref:ImmA/IrrE family metallo-endopeptidase n=1 Tax=Pseudomonas graminis TaxID=158627 RepID=UPI00234BC814|nr:ImmA/IrrE family metallo-endopeptidase [Pseudomonas graminis]MDC6378853.1 ImmA/IrrE family metallo-endopeptidase [Pseudomonas graminis]